MALGLVANFAKPAFPTICYLDCTGEEPGLLAYIRKWLHGRRCLGALGTHLASVHRC